MKQVVELQDEECFIHTYDKRTIHQVVRQQCLGGDETGVLDTVITTEVGFIGDDKQVHVRKTGREERCNPYAYVITVKVVGLSPED